MPGVVDPADRAPTNPAALQEGLEGAGTVLGVLADPVGAELRLRLAVEETASEPEEVVACLGGEATRRAVTALTRGASDAEVGLVTRAPLLLLEQLSEADSRRDAIESLLLWLGSRS